MFYIFGCGIIFGGMLVTFPLADGKIAKQNKKIP